MKTTEYPSSLTEAQFEQIKPCLNAQRRSKWNLLNIVNAILYVCDGGVKWRKDYFVFGCTAALRYSDLMNLSVHDVECRSGRYFLVYRSIKTDTPVSIKLPDYAASITKAMLPVNSLIKSCFLTWQNLTSINTCSE